MTEHNRYSYHIFLRYLISALSYWGVAARILLVGFILLVFSAMEMMYDKGPAMSYIGQLIYFLGTFLVLDIIYVSIAKSYQIDRNIIDRVVFLGIYLILATIVALSYLVILPTSLQFLVRWLPIVGLFILSLRLVLASILTRRT